MKTKNILVLSFFILFHSVATAQSSHMTTTKTTISKSFALKVKKTDVNRDSIKQLISQKLLSDVARSIASKISQDSVNGNYSIPAGLNKTPAEQYHSLDYIASMIVSINPDFKFSSFDNKEVTGTISFLKNDFAKGYFTVLKSKIDSAKLYVDSKVVESKIAYDAEKNKIIFLKRIYVEILSIYKVIELFDGNLLESNNWVDQEIKKIRTATFSGVPINESADFQKKLLEIQLLRQEKKYQSALNAINELQKLHQTHEYLMQLKLAVLNDFEVLKIDQLNDNDPMVILAAIDYLENIDIFFRDKYSDKKSLCKRKAFQQYMKTAQSEFDAGEYGKAESSLSIIRPFAAIDEPAFVSMENKVKHAIAKDELDNIQDLIHKKDFYLANKLLKDARTKCLTREDQERWAHLKKEILKKSIASELREARKLKPFMWQAQVGGGFHNLTTLETINTVSSIDAINTTPIPYFTIGLFRKLNVKMRQDGTPARGSNLIGLKLAWSAPQLQRTTNISYPLTSVFYSSFLEPQLSIFFIRFIELSVGKVFQLTDINNKTIPLNSFYIGIKPRIHNIHLNLGIKYLTDGAGQDFISANGGMQIAIDFKRKMNRALKLKIRKETESQMR